MTSDLIELAERAKRRLEAQAASGRKEEEKWRTAEEAHSEWVKKQEAQVIDNARFILEWAKDFARSDEGKKVLSVLNEVSLFSGPAYMEDGRVADRGFFWFLRLEKDGTLTWMNQLKWMGRRDVVVRRPKDMLCWGLSPRNVEGARRALESGEFRESIRHQLERAGRPSM